MKKSLIFILFLAGCATSAKYTGSTASPEIERLENGAEIIAIRDNTLPIINLGLIVKQGSSSDPMGQSGLSELMINTWLENPEMAETLANMGGSHSHDLMHDFFVIAGSNLSEKRDDYLNAFFKLLTKPKFSPKTFENKRQQTLSLMKRISDDADLLADVAFQQYIYGSHPYGRASYGNPDDIQKITFSQITAKYSKVLVPGQMIFILAGDFDENFRQQLKSKVLEFKAAPIVPIHRPHPPDIKGIQIVLIDKPDVTQAQIEIGQFSVNRTDEDYEKLNLAQNILGGGYSSRLNQKIRVEKGLTYDVHTELETDIFETVMKISTSTKNENIEAVLREIFSTYKDFVENGVTAEELEMAQNSLQARLLRNVESPDGYVIWLAAQRFYDLKQTSVKEAIDKIKDPSVSQVNRAIKKYMNPKKLKIVVVAPAKKVLPTLQTFGIVEVKRASDF